MLLKHRSTTVFMAGLLLVLAGGCVDRDVTGPGDSLADPATAVRYAGSPNANAQACWGQASAAFAALGAMGEHASSFATPRLGLRNVARLLYDQGVLSEDSLQALGAFLSNALGLSIDACL